MSELFFGAEFLDCAAEGADMSVPSLSTKWREEKNGCLWGKYWPRVFWTKDTFHCALPQHLPQHRYLEKMLCLLTDFLFESLLLNLNQCESDLMATALHEGIDNDGQGEFLYLPDQLGVKMVPA